MAKTNEFNDVPVPKRDIHVLTVDELYKELAIARKNGWGKKKIMIPDDDECNGFHLMFHSITDKTEAFFESPYMHLPCGVRRSELKDYVILG